MIRMRTKLYFAATGAYAAFAVLGAIVGSLPVLMFSFAMTAFCLWQANRFLEEDAETLMNKLEDK